MTGEPEGETQRDGERGVDNEMRNVLGPESKHSFVKLGPAQLRGHGERV